MNVDPNLHFEAASASRQLLDKYCTSFAGTSVSASALATVAALLSLSTASDHPPTPASGSGSLGAPDASSVSHVSGSSNAASATGAHAALTSLNASAGAGSPSGTANNTSGGSTTLTTNGAGRSHSRVGNAAASTSSASTRSKGSEPAPRTPSTTINERFHVFLCSGYDDHSGSDASSSRSHATDSSSASRRTPPVPTNTLPESWLTAAATTSPSGRTNHSSCVFTFHYCVKSCGPSGAFAVYEAKIIPVSANILLASAPLYVTQSRLTDITTFQAPTIGVFVRESSSHRRRQLSTTPYTPESIELYAEVIAELLRNSPFMAAVSPRTALSSKASTQRGDSTNSNTPEHVFGRPHGASSSSSFGSAGGGPHRFGDTDLRPRRSSNRRASEHSHNGGGSVAADRTSGTIVGADGSVEAPADSEVTPPAVPWEV